MGENQSKKEEQPISISSGYKSILSKISGKLKGNPRFILEIIGIILILSLSTSLVGKVPQKDYDSLESKYINLQNDYSALQNSYDNISSENENLLSKLKTIENTLETTRSDYTKYQTKMQAFDKLSDDDLSTVASQVEQIIMNKRAAEAQAVAEAQAAAQAQATAEAQAAAQAQAVAQAQANQQAQEQTVWIPRSGSKYHSHSSCSNMKNPSQVTLSEAQSRGYKPCKKCY